MPAAFTFPRLRRCWTCTKRARPNSPPAWPSAEKRRGAFFVAVRTGSFRSACGVFAPTFTRIVRSHPAAPGLLIRFFCTSAGPDGPIPELEELVVDLRHHQKAAIHWMLDIEQVNVKMTR